MLDIDSQREALARLPEKRFVQISPQVKGPFTSGSYVVYKLNEIFGPDNWRHTITHGPDIVRLSDTKAYVQAVVRLDAQFANGNQVTHEDVGVWPLMATKANEGGTLDDTAPERYETVLKACVTDAIKACAEYLGVCFRPLSDHSLSAALTAAAAVSSIGTGDNGKVQAAAPEPAQPAAKPAAAAAPKPAPSPAVPAGPRKQAALKCSLKEFDRLAVQLANKYPQYKTPKGEADKSHILYTMAAVGFPLITDANLEPAYEAAARHAAGLPAPEEVPF